MWKRSNLIIICTNEKEIGVTYNSGGGGKKERKRPKTLTSRTVTDCYLLSF